MWGLRHIAEIFKIERFKVRSRQTNNVRWQALAAVQICAQRSAVDWQSDIGSDSNEKPLQRVILPFRCWVFLGAPLWYQSVIRTKG